MAKAILGGLMVGAGRGMVEQAENRRQEALERVRHERRQQEREQDRGWRQEDRAEDRQWRQEDRAEDRQWRQEDRAEDREFTLQRDELQQQRLLERDAAQDERRGLLSGAALDDVESDGVTQLTASDRSLINTIAQNYWGRMNEAGQWAVDPNARDNYTLTVSRAEELAMRGVPVTEAARLATLSVSGPASEAKAREISRKEADNQITGWFRGGDKEEYIERRIPEIMEESRVALRRYEELTGRDKRPSGSGTRDDPFQASTQEQIDWFRDSAPSGTVIEVNGTLYTK